MSIIVKCFRLITIYNHLSKKPFIRSYAVKSIYIQRKGEKTGDCTVFYERNKKAFNFDEDDAIRLYASKKYDGTSLSSLSHRKTFIVFFILFREWPFLDKVKLHTGHNKEWKSKRKRRSFWGEKRVLPIAKYFVFISFWLHEADDKKANGKVYLMMKLTILLDFILQY